MSKPIAAFPSGKTGVIRVDLLEYSPVILLGVETIALWTFFFGFEGVSFHGLFGFARRSFTAVDESALPFVFPVSLFLLLQMLPSSSHSSSTTVRPAHAPRPRCRPVEPVHRVIEGLMRLA